MGAEPSFSSESRLDHLIPASIQTWEEISPTEISRTTKLWTINFSLLPANPQMHELSKCSVFGVLCYTLVNQHNTTVPLSRQCSKLIYSSFLFVCLFASRAQQRVDKIQSPNKCLFLNFPLSSPTLFLSPVPEVLSRLWLDVFVLTHYLIPLRPRFFSYILLCQPFTKAVRMKCLIWVNRDEEALGL